MTGRHVTRSSASSHREVFDVRSSPAISCQFMTVLVVSERRDRRDRRSAIRSPLSLPGPGLPYPSCPWNRERGRALACNASYPVSATDAMHRKSNVRLRT